MADYIRIKHAFQLTKPNSPDNTIVSSDAWNDNELITGGQDGQVMTRSSAVLTGGAYVHGPRVQSVSDNFSSPTGVSVTPSMAALSIQYTSNCDVLIIIEVASTISSGTSVIINLYRNGSIYSQRQVQSGAGNAGNSWYSTHEAATEGPGAVNYGITIVPFIASTLTAAAVKLTVMSVGKL